MESAKEKISNLASAAKEKVEICKAKAEEKSEKATAKTKEEKKIAEERRKAREAEAKKEMHEAHARHAAEKLRHKQVHLHHHAGHPNPALYGSTATAATAATAGPTVTAATSAIPAYGQNEAVYGTQGQHHQPVGIANPMAGGTGPAYPPGTHLERNRRL